MKKGLLILLSIVVFCEMNGQGIWMQQASLPAYPPRDGAVGFSIGSYGYIATGKQGPWLLSDLWEWNSNANTWTQKANFPGGRRQSAVGWAIGNKGYIVTGGNGNPHGNYPTDFWEWDQPTNTWLRKADFPGICRWGAVGFSIGTKAYVGTGTFTNDFWEWDQSSDTWTLKAAFPGSTRNMAVGFAIGNKGYIGTGYTAPAQSDFWEYDPSLDSWTQKANFAGGPRSGAVGFSIGTKGYIGTGVQSTTLFQDFWEWDQSLNTWTQQTNFGGAPRIASVGFSIGTNGYIGTGQDNSGNYNDFWEFKPGFSTNGIVQEIEDYELNAFPNPASTQVTIHFTFAGKGTLELKIRNCLGQLIYSDRQDDFTGEYIKTIPTADNPAAVYFAEIILCDPLKEGKPIIAVRKMVLE